MDEWMNGWMDGWKKKEGRAGQEWMEEEEEEEERGQGRNGWMDGWIFPSMGVSGDEEIVSVEVLVEV